MFQRYALFPHLNVYENVEFGLKLRKMPESDANSRCGRCWSWSTSKGLSGATSTFRRPAAAGSHRQALVNHPKVLLLDEPLGALDLKLRKDADRAQTHPAEPGDHLHLCHPMTRKGTYHVRPGSGHEGRVTSSRSAPLKTFYNEPANAFVADFISESNIMDGLMYDDFKVQFAGNEFECVDKGFGQMKQGGRGGPA